MTKAQSIVQVANTYVGQKEITGNKGFQNKDFQKKMELMGFLSGQSWCAYFSELVWKEAYGKGNPLIPVLDKLFSASAVATFSNFKGNQQFKTGTIPKLGALSVWRYGNGWQGHIGIVTEIIDSNTYRTIEGNGNSQGGREGVEVVKKVRKTGQPFTAKGLNLIGFIYPLEN